MADTPNTENATVSDLADLGALTGAAASPATPSVAAEDDILVAAPPPPRGGPLAPLREKEIDAQGRAYATGRRKDAVARVWLSPASRGR